MVKKLTRAEAIAVAQSARRLPKGVSSDRVRIQLPQPTSEHLLKESPAERGGTYSLGLEFKASGYLLIYRTLDALGVRIISTILGEKITIVCRHKTYEGDNQVELLLEILRDRLENFNYLTPGGIVISHENTKNEPER